MLTTARGEEWRVFGGAGVVRVALVRARWSVVVVSGGGGVRWPEVVVSGGGFVQRKREVGKSNAPIPRIRGRHCNVYT